VETCPVWLGDGPAPKQNKKVISQRYAWVVPLSIALTYKILTVDLHTHAGTDSESRLKNGVLF